MGSPRRYPIWNSRRFSKKVSSHVTMKVINQLMVCTFTLTPALEKPVKFTAPPTSGVEGVDETVRSSSFTFRLQVDELLTFTVGVSIGVRDVSRLCHPRSAPCRVRCQI